MCRLSYSTLSPGLPQVSRGATSLCKIGRLSEPAKGRLPFYQFWFIACITLPMMSREGSDNIIAVHHHIRCLIKLKPKSKSKSKSLIQSLLWVLLGPIGSYWVLLDPIGSYWVLLSPIESYWILLGPIGSYWVLLGPIGSYWVLLGPIWSYWELLGPIGSY